ncbi:uncharacterized protein [Haliotis asinina]|uniref:uncharacterized protein n=1 Tax=Haliotis asinina TaxID=109174 RepID=UPI0035326BB1
MIDDKKEHSQEDKLFKEKVQNSIAYRNGHFSLKLSFRKENVCLPKNQTQAFHRLQSLKEKLKRNQKFHEDYTEFMNNILTMGYAEKVPEDRIKREIGNEWYIPHHGIYHSRKPDKIRVVFDCSATYHGISLNSQLLSGPDLTSNLIGVLLRFRQENIAFMGDFESMFYQVQVPEEDIDYLRFLWWEDGDLQQEPTTYRMKVHLFGAVSSPSCSNAALRKTADVNKEFYDEEVRELIKKNFYVDDCLWSAAGEERAVTLIRQITSLCQRGGFRLTKWMSNSYAVLDSIPPEERAKGLKHLDLENSELPPERALGVFWEVEKDILGFKVNLRHHMDTKRGILATMSSVYDPIGLLSPFLLTTKSLLQTLCRQNVGWNDKIEGDVLRKWTQRKENLLHIEELHVMRSYKPRDFGPVRTCELHMFSDASDIGYGVVAYLRKPTTEMRFTVLWFFPNLE